MGERKSRIASESDKEIIECHRFNPQQKTSKETKKLFLRKKKKPDDKEENDMSQRELRMVTDG